MISVDYPKLLSPGQIGKVRTKNRLIKTAQGSSVVEPETGYIGERALNYYENLVKGGVGLIIVESCGVEYPLGVHHPPVQFRLHEDALIPSFYRLTSVAHKHNTPIFIQLIHSGPWNPTGLRNLKNARCSSTLTKDQLPGPDFVETQAMTLDEIAMVQDMFVKAAERAYRAGFDGVEINAGTCTLPNSFISRVFNRRTDQYGCDTLENRARFVAEIISSIRYRLDSRFAVTVITNIAEYGHPLATPIEEGARIAKIFQNAGAEAVQVRGHYYGHRDGLMHPDRFFYPELPANAPKDLDWRHKGAGAYLPFAAAVKKAGVTVPVIAAGRMDPVLGEQALQDGKVEFIGMTRRLLADPELPKKLMENRPEDIRPCLGCLHCMDVRLQNKYVQCRINPQINREKEINYESAGTVKRVLVIGGGPGGMEAARVAAIRGHEVYLYDRQNKLGGLINVAAVLKEVETEAMTRLVKWYSIQLSKLGVHVVLQQEVNDEVIKELKPDVIIAATGGKYLHPNISGFETSEATTNGNFFRHMRNSLTHFSPQTFSRLSHYYMPVGKKVIVIGSQLSGCETTEFLIKRNREVIMVDGIDDMGEGMTGDDKSLLFPWLEKKGVKRYLGVKYNYISKGKLGIITKDGKNMVLEADTIMTALPMSPNKEFMSKLKGKAPEVYSVGDCLDPALIEEATASAALIASQI